MNVVSILGWTSAAREEALNLLKDAVSIDSQVINQGSDGNEAKIQEYFKKCFEGMQLEVCKFYPDNEKLCRYDDFNQGHTYENRPNIVATWKGKGGGRSIILNGHADTVAFGNLGLWRANPFKPEVIDGKLYGLGAADMKSGLCALIMAVKILKQHGVELRGNVLVQSVVDEEGGGNGSLACVDSGYNADAAIVAEPTDLNICVCHRGAMHLKIEAEGRSCHTSMRDNGINAIDKMRTLLEALQILDARWNNVKRHPFLTSGAITCAFIQGGTGASMVPDKCMAMINIKYLPYEKAENVREEIQECIDEICKKDSWLKQCPPKLSWMLNTSAYEMDSTNPIVQVVRESCKEVGLPENITGMPSGTDARILNNIGRIPTLILGPGFLADAHKPNEGVALEDYFKAIELYANIIFKWCG